MQTTLTRRGITQQITLTHESYGTDQDGTGYVKLNSGFWMSYKFGSYWSEVEQAETLPEAA